MFVDIVTVEKHFHPNFNTTLELCTNIEIGPIDLPQKSPENAKLNIPNAEF